jgi:putative membrane protein
VAREARRALSYAAMNDAALPQNVLPPGDRPFFVFNAVVSTLALALLAYLLLLHQVTPGTGLAPRYLPAVNASLNATAALLLLCGYIAVKRRAYRVHRYFMVSAFVASSLFLLCYLAYHYLHGDTKFQGVGPVRLVYFAILISHIVLSTAVVPLALTAFYFAWRRRFASHAKVTRILWPIWMYVSVTGVVVFFFLRSSY